MSHDNAISPAAPVVPPFEPTKEVRFAVVMFGGVSLAIYINGVTQELLHLVRATAPEPGTGAALLANDKLGSTEAVYRKLGQLVLETGRVVLAEPAPGDPIRTRFVIDVISGTSAGGINGIVLAKALANDQDIGQLRDMWIHEGDIASLINDDASVKGLPLTAPRRPQSLLNSQRMFLKLIDAFESMDQRPACPCSPYVDELDLYVTLTDIAGSVVPLRTADNVVYERRHRNVLHFVYATAAASGADRNDFDACNSPFLAFAARCTSSFPVAFDPMALADVALAPRYTHDPEGFQRDVARWSRFLDGQSPQDMLKRSFGDGGYLDNKPFGHATDTLSRRRANMRVDRKLVYIEPSPARPDQAPVPSGKPDFLQNAVAALITLPGYETVREDFQRLRDRNRLIERVNRIARGVEMDVARGGRTPPPREPGTKWRDQDLTQMVERFGVSYGGYHRLKIAAVTDDLTSLIGHLSGCDDESDAWLAIRYLVRVWRDSIYVEYYPPGADGSPDQSRPTQNCLLFDLDLTYRLRRLNFVRDKIDELYPFDTHAQEMLGAIERASGTALLPVTDPAEFQRDLLAIKQHLSGVFVDLRRSGREVRRGRRNDGRLSGMVRNLGISAADLAAVVAEPGELRRQLYARGLMEKVGGVAAFEAIAREVAEQLRSPLIQAADACDALLRVDMAWSAPVRTARLCVQHYYQRYEEYDLITFPLHYGTGVGESDEVEVIRISPEDATGLIDERHDGRAKLAGTALFNFGAFLDRLWRENDIMWGRLDGAERIIRGLLPEHPDKARQLIREAHKAIVREELPPKTRDQLHQDLLKALTERTNGTVTETDLRRLIDEVDNGKVQAFLDACLDLDDAEWRRLFQSAYSAKRNLDREASMRSLARGTSVAGKMLEELTEQHQVHGTPAAWVTRTGRLLWGFVEIAAPRSSWELIGRYWFRVLYLFEAFMFAGGWVLGSKPVQSFGLAAFGVTAAINGIVLLLGEYLRGGRRGWRAAAILAVILLVGLAALGVLKLVDLMELLRRAWVP